VLTGGKMIFEAVRARDDRASPPARLGLYLDLAIATSIDAAAAGLTLPFFPVAPWIALVLIGTITAACSAIGYLAGVVLGKRFGSRLEILGGLVLIGIGVQLLLR
jgi:putative Mn2+ efflux pump MntP